MQALRLADSQLYAEVARWSWERCVRLAWHNNKLVISWKNGIVGEIEQDGLVFQQNRGPDCWAIYLRRAVDGQHHAVDGQHREVLAVDYDPADDMTHLVLTLGSGQRYRFELPPALGRRAGELMERVAAAWQMPRVPLFGRDCL